MRIYRAACIPANAKKAEIRLTDYEHRYLSDKALLQIAKECIKTAGIDVDIDDIVIDEWIDNGQY
jgi:hypothetical protein